jgi:hypothetical protein
MPQYRKFGDKASPWPKLRRFRPITRMTGKRGAWTALIWVILGYFAPLLVFAAGGSDLTGNLFGTMLCIGGAVKGWNSRDSRGRGVAYVAAYLGAFFGLLYLAFSLSGA